MGRTPRSGDVLNGRFAIEHLAGAGGMGQVCRARDLRSGGLVALKVMHDAERLEIERFAREAQVLATLSHPRDRPVHPQRGRRGGRAVPGHGVALRRDARRAPAALGDHARRDARARPARRLGAGRDPHRRGVVHRDVKPSNLFLRNGSIDDVALIDFGMARRPIADPKLTATGTMVARRATSRPSRSTTCRASTGAPTSSRSAACSTAASRGARRSAASRMLLNGTPDQLPKLRELRSSVPADLDDLVMRMLSRSSGERPPASDAVAARAPGDRGARADRGAGAGDQGGAAERALGADGDRAPPVRPLIVRFDRLDGRGAAAAADARAAHRLACARRSAPAASSRAWPTARCSRRSTTADAAADLSARAARCALGVSAAVIGGRLDRRGDPGSEVIGPAVPESELLDRAIDLLEATERGASLPILIDDRTASLLGPRFDVSGGRRLRGERRGPAGAGRAPGAVWRRARAWAASRSWRSSRRSSISASRSAAAGMVTLTGEAGVGKSLAWRARSLRRLLARGQDHRDLARRGRPRSAVPRRSGCSRRRSGRRSGSRTPPARRAPRAPRAPRSMRSARGCGRASSSAASLTRSARPSS